MGEWIRDNGVGLKNERSDKRAIHNKLSDVNRPNELDTEPKVERVVWFTLELSEGDKG